MNKNKIFKLLKEVTEMKGIIFTITAFMFFLNISYSQENFIYASGTNLRDYWYYIGPLGNDNYVKITDESLTFPHYAGSGIGKAALLDITGPELTWQFIEFTGFSTGSVYTSFMVKVESAEPAGAKFADIGNSVIIPTRYFTTGGVFVKESSGKIAFGVSKNSASPPVYTNASYQTGIVYLIILKYIFMPGSDNDSLNLFVFSGSAPNVEPLPDLKAIPEYSDIPDVGSFEIIMGIPNAPRLIIDGIYMRNYWDEVILPVEYSSLNAYPEENRITLKWSTVYEQNNYGFDIEKSKVLIQSSDVWSKAGFVPGSGTTSSVQNYTFTDRNLSTGSYKYRLKQIDFNGNFSYHELNNEFVIGVPDKFSLNQNYPNPFNPATKIGYNIAAGGNVSLKVFDITGREVKTIVNGFKEAGYYTADFSGSEFANGIYFCRLESGIFSATRKMILLK